ncbi:MAG: septum formation initiator family protein [Clostridia bacterium]|nr:septum formation initiator family protein [Clostridia bacterium]
MASGSTRRNSIILRVVLIFFAIVMIFYLGSLIKEYSSLQKQYDAVSQKRDELRLEVEQKANMLENGTDEEFIKRAARERLGYVFGDEHLYIDISGN